MTTICQKCLNDNAIGRTFCQFCGTKLVALPHRESLGSGVASAQDSSVAADVAASQNPPGQTSPEELRLNKALAASEKRVAELQRDLDAAKDKSIAAALQNTDERIAEETRLRESLTASTQRIAALEKDLNAVNQKAAAGSREMEQIIARQNKLIEEFQKKPGSAAEHISVPGAKPAGAADTHISWTDLARRPRLYVIAGIAMMLAGVGGFGGFTVGKRFSNGSQAQGEVQAKFAAAKDANEALKTITQDFRVKLETLENQLRAARAAHCVF